MSDVVPGLKSSRLASADRDVRVVSSMVNDERVSLPSLNPSPNFTVRVLCVCTVGALPAARSRLRLGTVELSTVKSVNSVSQISNDRMPSLSNLSEPRAGTQAGQRQAGLA